LPRLASAIPVVFAVFMRLLQKQEADNPSDDDDSSADEVGQKKGIAVEEGAREPGEDGSRPGQQAAESSPDDGATKWRSVGGPVRQKGPG